MQNLKIVGIGTDIMEVTRFRRKPLKRHNMTFYNSIFSECELKYCSKYVDPYPHLAGIFAAKEAVIKCTNALLGMKDIEVIQDTYRKPNVIIRRGKKNIAIKISISHTRSIAIAIAILMS